MKMFVPVLWMLVHCTALFAPARAHGQVVPLVTVQGVAIDSLRGKPLAGAFISASGRSAVSDSEGRFRLDSLPSGAQLLSLQHDLLDSIGLTGIAIRIVARNDGAVIQVATPSIASLWLSVCARARPLSDSGIIFGTVREIVSRRGTPGNVLATWTDLSASIGGGVKQKRWTLATSADTGGNFALCGVPFDVLVQVHVATVAAASGYIDVQVPPQLGIQRRDLSVAVLGDDVGLRGSISGMLADEAGQPVASARVRVLGMQEVQSNADGRFLLHNVPSGTQQLEVLSLGNLPLITSVDVVPKTVTAASLVVSKGHLLDTVNVRASSVRQHILAEIDERRKSGFGQFVDSLRVNQQARLLSVFEPMPGVRVAGGKVILGSGGSSCDAYVWVDGLRINPKDVVYEIVDMKPSSIAIIEVYPHAATVPAKFQGKLGRACGAVAIWTKRMLP